MWALEAAIASGDRAKAEELVEWIEKLPPGLRPPSMGAHAHRARGPLAGPGEAAFADHAAATARFRDLGVRFWHAVSLLEHGGADR